MGLPTLHPTRRPAIHTMYYVVCIPTGGPPNNWNVTTRTRWAGQNPDEQSLKSYTALHYDLPHVFYTRRRYKLKRYVGIYLFLFIPLFSSSPFCDLSPFFSRNQDPGAPRRLFGSLPTTVHAMHVYIAKITAHSLPRHNSRCVVPTTHSSGFI